MNLSLFNCYLSTFQIFFQNCNKTLDATSSVAKQNNWLCSVFKHVIEMKIGVLGQVLAPPQPWPG